MIIREVRNIFVLVWYVGFIILYIKVVGKKLVLVKKY